MEKGAIYEIKRGIEMYQLAQEQGISILAINYLVEYHTNTEECSDLESVEWVISLLHNGTIKKELKGLGIGR